MNILITGGAGFVGSHLSAILLKDGHQVTVFDNFSYGKRSLLPDSDQLNIIQGDILDKTALASTFTSFEPELVFHLAAIHHIPTCEKNPSLALRTNVEGTQNVLESAVSHNVKKIVFASSGAVYEIVDTPLREDETPVVPHDIYSITKLSGEYLLRLQAERGNIKAVACRLFNTVGSHETNEHLVPDILKQIKAGKKEIRLGNLTPLRSYIHVMDVADGFYRAGMKDLGKSFETLNIGTETENSVLDIFNIISDVSGLDLSVSQDHSKVRKVDRHRQLASLEKTTKLLDWTPRRSLKEALQDAYNESMYV